ncbi:L-threonylcarbamoyladenylate synthase [Candidatus Rariloculus sp.]|uniref:L-threonylcarbamoyladenylate synthase n=1 Tax=Candidatus Rariloculus sp. TaxID=3101265 RepID=UPI003D133745
MASKLHIDRAARTVLAGGIVAYPTEAVYGLGCLPFEHDAVRRLIALKQRSRRKGFVLIAAELGQLDDIVILPERPLRDEILASWPGPVTWSLPARSRMPDWLTGGRETVAVRVTRHPLASLLCRRAGHALVSTSANLSGRAPLRSVLQVRREFGALVDYVLPGALGDLTRPTVIRDGRTGATLRA